MKNTKKALLLSVMSLVLCVSMLVGTTFAWFTDSVSTAKNTIASGNLDVVLSYKLDKNAAWAEVNENTELFDDAALWEPGYTQVVYLKVANAGSLALKYQLGLNILSELSGTNVDEETFKLSDYIQFGVIETKTENFFADRDEARKAVTSSKKISAGYSKASELYATNNVPTDGLTEEYVALVVYMPETVGNEANHLTGTAAPSITLGLNLVATQLMAEEDSFDETYDKDAWVEGWEVRTEQDLLAALNNGKTNIILMDNIAVTAPVVIPAGATVKLNLNGKTLSAASGNVIQNKGTLEVKGGTVKSETTYGINNSGNVTVTDTAVNAMYNSGEMTANNVAVANTISGRHGIYHSGTALTVNGGTYSSTSGNELIHAAAGNVTINGGEFTQIGKSYLFGAANAGIVINGGTFNGYVNPNGTNDMMRPGAAKVSGGTFNFNPTNWLEPGFKALENNGNYVVVPENVDKVIATAADLAALSNGKISGTWALMADIDMTGYDMQPIMLGGGNVLTFLGNGHTISNLNLVAATQNGMSVSGLFNILHSGTELNVSDLTVENVTSTSSKYASAMVAYNSTSLVINLDNVDVKGANVKGESVAALVCYSTSNVNLTNCDVSGLKLDGAFDENKVGAYIGTANTATCTATVNGCTNDSAYSAAGRVLNGAVLLIDGGTFLSDGITKGANNTYSISNANGLATMNAMMADKSAGRDAIVKLTSDIDFTGKTWTMVDSHADSAFELLELDGQGHTISNFNISGQAMFSRFAGTGDVTIRDITFDNATVNNAGINCSILTVQTYQNVLLDNVDVKNSSITGAYKVAPLMGTVYNESPSAITATVKNCDISNTVVTTTQYDFCTAGMIAFVYEGNADRAVFENCTVSGVKLCSVGNGYAAHAWIYVNDADTDDCFNEVAGVTVTGCTFENK